MAMETLTDNKPQFLKKKYFLIVFHLVISVIMFSCVVPASKESYLKKFEKFVERVEKNHENFNKKDWKWADVTFGKFTNEWYREYKNKLTPEEELKVIALKLKYQSYKQPDVIQEILRDLKVNSSEIKEKINQYIDKDLDNDVDQIIKGMKEIGDSALKVVDDVIQKIDNRF
jgi:hypothetical protein